MLRAGRRLCYGPEGVVMRTRRSGPGKAYVFKEASTSSGGSSGRSNASMPNEGTPLESESVHNVQGGGMHSFNALEWWNMHKLKYRVLSRMAMDVLAVPISTVASDSTFSAGGRVIDPYRSLLAPDTVQMLICGGDWIRQMYGIKKKLKVPFQMKVFFGILALMHCDYEVEPVNGFSILQVLQVNSYYTRESDAAYSALPQKGAAFFPPKMPVPPSGPSKHHNSILRLRFIPTTVVDSLKRLFLKHFFLHLRSGRNLREKPVSYRKKEGAARPGKRSTLWCARSSQV
uniref:HAT C-terminal dimerisation domain-containing protein n=1 Tax=Lactuca sativa TaxID=4236 RepID=A0A9R1WRH0_LACSA|nr:hypothetical protein LSAT_V11C100019670 [Lactuca sativa]